MNKFDKLYNIIMEDLTPDLKKIITIELKLQSAPSNGHLEFIYNTNKEIIDNNENLILALLNNGNATHALKNLFRNCPFKSVQEFFIKQDEPFTDSYLNDNDADIYKEFTKGEI
jgi:hypothetical protein